MHRKLLHRITILVLDEEKQDELFNSKELLNEIERVITHEEKYPLRVIRFPSGEKVILYHTDDFLKLNEEQFVEDLLAHSVIAKSRNKYTLLLVIRSDWSDNEEIIAKYSKIETVLLSKNQNKIVPKHDPEIYRLHESREVHDDE